MTPSVASVTFTCSDSNHSSSRSAALWVKIFTSATVSLGAQAANARGEFEVLNEIAQPGGREVRGAW